MRALLSLAIMAAALVSSAQAAEYSGYAPPLIWGKPMNLPGHLGAATYRLKLEPVNNVGSQVSGRVTYVDEKGQLVTTEFTDSIKFRTGNVAAQPWVTLKAIPTGTHVRVIVNP